ncbi:MAG: hypothetical protein JWO03_2709 [Bacteroidetes bacterium]|nr:hypothetical protein [Bacteroidota bacterium]
MGAWDSGIFDDDSAWDFLDTVGGSDAPQEIFKTAFGTAINADYLEYDDCHAVTVSAACIDNMVNGTQYADQEVVNTFGEKHDISVSDLKVDAVKALHIVLSDKSELNDLWAENEEDYPAWKQNIEDLILRLT